MKPKLDPAVICLKTAYEIAFSPVDSRVAFIGGRDITVLDIETRKNLFVVHPIANPSHIDFSPDGSLLAVKGTSGRTIVLDAKNGRLISDFRNAKEGEGGAALFSPCGRSVISVSWDSLFSVRDWATGKITFSNLGSTECQLDNLCTTADRQLYAYVANHPPHQNDGPTPSTVALRSASQLEEEITLPREWVAIWGLQLSPSGRLLAVMSGTPPNALEVVEVAAMRRISTINCSAGSGGCSIAWSSSNAV